MASTATVKSNGRLALSRLIPVVISVVLIGTLLILVALKASAPQKPPRASATPLAGPAVLGNLDIPFYVWNGEEHHYKKDAPVIFARPGVPSIFAVYLTSDGKLVREAEGAFEVVKSAGGMINDREFREGEKFLVRIGNDPDNKNFFTIPLTLFPGTHLFDLKFGSDTWRVSFQTVSLVANSVMYDPPATTSGLEAALQSNPDVKVALASLDVVSPEKCRAKQVQSTGFYMLAYNGGVITQGDWVPEGKWVWLLECDITIDGKTEAKLIPINPDCLNPQFKKEVVPTPVAVATPQPSATPIVPVAFGPVPVGPTWTPERREVIAQATETPVLVVVTATPIPTSVPQLTPSPTNTPAAPATVTPQPATATPNYVVATLQPATNTPGPAPTSCPCPTPQFSPAPSFTPGPPPTPVVTPLPTHTRPAETPVVSATFTMVPWNTPGPSGTKTPVF